MLHALLGSCIGIAILWPQKRLYGLAHCLFAEAPEKSSSISGRYVDQAIFSLLALMHIHKEDFYEVQAVIAGGGNMTMPDTTESEKLVGVINTKAAVKCLNGYKLKIVHEDTGGLEGRNITIRCSTGSFEIRKIPRILTV